MDKSKEVWSRHYQREKSILEFPDENLVRLISKKSGVKKGLLGQWALDLGCGSGRHLSLLRKFGLLPIGLDIAELSPAAIQGKVLTDSPGLDPLPRFIYGSGLSLPFVGDTFGAVVAWGSLHYGTFSDAESMIVEIYRVLKKGGFFWGTLRSTRDTFLERGEKVSDNEWLIKNRDIHGSRVTFFEEKSLGKLFGQFNSCNYGLMERTPLGERHKIISHLFFQARK